MEKRSFTQVFLLLAFLALVPVSVSAQIRDYVGIVRQTYHPDVVTYLQKLRDTLKDDGYTRVSESINGFIEGGFGSGFVYVAQNGKNYIITNRHVVSQAYTASVEFENVDGTYTKYDNLTILAIDEDIDLAILAFPADKQPFKQGMQLDVSSREDGEEIWSAGFPALGDKPMWQLGKGTITNARARIAELADPEKTVLIQHSAQTDSGNSGGPLLLASKSAPGGYKVIGVNTWKAINRQATNYSIPSQTISAFITRTLANTVTVDNDALVRERASNFINMLTTKNPAYGSIIKYISYDYVALNGEKALKDVLAKAPSSVREEVLDVFSYYSPIEGMRYAIAYTLEKSMRNTDDKIFLSLDSVTKAENNKYSVNFVSPTAKTTSSWIQEHGVWRIGSFGDDKKTAEAKGSVKKDKSSFDIKSPYSLLLLGTYAISTSSEEPNAFRFLFLANGSDYTSWGFSVFHSSGDTTVKTDSYSGLTTSSDFSLNVVLVNFRIQVPLLYENFSLTPFINGAWGLGHTSLSNTTDSGTIVSGYTLEPGILCGIGSNQRFFVETSYMIKNFKDVFSGSTGTGFKINKGMFALSAGVGF